MSSAGQTNAALADGLISAPSAGVAEGKRAGFVRAVDLDVERPAVVAGGDMRVDPICAGRAYVDRVFHPLARLDVPDIEAIASPAVDVDGFIAAEACAEMLGGGVVIRDAFAPGVKVFRL